MTPSVPMNPSRRSTIFVPPLMTPGISVAYRFLERRRRRRLARRAAPGRPPAQSATHKRRHDNAATKQANPGSHRGLLINAHDATPVRADASTFYHDVYGRRTTFPLNHLRSRRSHQAASDQFPAAPLSSAAPGASRPSSAAARVRLPSGARQRHFDAAALELRARVGEPCRRDDRGAGNRRRKERCGHPAARGCGHRQSRHHVLQLAHVAGPVDTAPAPPARACVSEARDPTRSAAMRQ